MNRNNTRRPGFSLIEVLIAVMVLAVGLLGLASVFPVVITQQRRASDVILGGVAASIARDQIEANRDIAAELLSQDGFADDDEPDLDGDRVPNETAGQDSDADADGDGVPDTFDPDVRDGLYVPGTDEPIFGQGFNYTSDNRRYNQQTGYSYLWEADWQWGGGVPGTVRLPDQYLTDYLADGGVRFRDPLERQLAGVNQNDADLPVGARLVPGPFSIPGGVYDGPQFVWDFVPRRTPEGGLQMAVFVRRIDTGIRVAEGRTLSEMLVTEQPGSPAFRFPVGRDTTTGEPTLDGTGEYSIPLSVALIPVPTSDYQYTTEARNGLPVLLDAVRLDFSAIGDDERATARPAEMRFLARVGQRFVDNFGVVRRVVEVLNIENNEIDLRVEPAYQLGQLYPPSDWALFNSSDALRELARTGKLRQAVFTPQVPADVFVMEFDK